jgi:hypothetical protein
MQHTNATCIAYYATCSAHDATCSTMRDRAWLLQTSVWVLKGVPKGALKGSSRGPHGVLTGYSRGTQGVLKGTQAVRADLVLRDLRVEEVVDERADVDLRQDRVAPAQRCNMQQV